jgi:hypothetical protein
MFNRLILKQYDKKWVAEMLEFYKPSVLVFDHAVTNRIYNIPAFWNVAKQKNIPTICLPHGIPLFIKHSSDYDRAKNDYINNECDFLVFQHRWWSDECIKYGLNSEKVFILGIARHCKEWETLLQQIVPPELSLENKGIGKLKVVYMDSGPDRYHEYKPVVQTAIDSIANLDFVHFIYKPHTRRNAVHLQIPLSAEIATDINSVNLVKWADVVVGMHSSIMIEVLLQDKVYISPTYFRKRKMIYEDYEACWMVHSTEELIDALKSLYENPSVRSYSVENVNRFITDVIYDGQKDRDVLKTYKDFILNIAYGQQETPRCTAATKM